MGGAVMTEPTAMDELAGQIQVALESADLDAYCELLDPDVCWGAPDTLEWGCHNRREVLDWYRRGRARGVRAHVVETAVVRDKILVGLMVHGPESSDSSEASNRWQVLTVVDGRVKDIRGFDDRDDAVSRMR